jgi:release factor glutamine methyltransferase
VWAAAPARKHNPVMALGEPQTVTELLDVGERVLRDSTHIFEDHDNRREAEDLLAYCLETDIDELDDSEVPAPRNRERYLAMIARRAGGEPFPFLIGTIEFYGLALEVRPGPFVPRPSSELTVERAVRRLRRRRQPVAVDVCTGAGPIALAIADELPHADVWGADIDDDGLNQGRRNARTLGIRNVTFRKGDMYKALPSRLRGRVDVITGHIPYIPVDEIDDLPTEVRGYEPVFTLSDQSSDGLELIRRAAFEAPEWLKPGGWLLLELSHDLPAKVQRICRKAGLETMGVASDEDDLSVVVEARRPR